MGVDCWDRTNRTDRPDWTDWTDRPDWTDWTDRRNRSDRSYWANRSYWAYRTYGSNWSNWSNRTDRTDRTDRAITMRTHVKDPTVTVIMETIGRDTIARAIRSFIGQDYPWARLLVINRHPQPLQLLNIPDSHRLRIEVVNEEDSYTRPVYQHIANLKMVRTDCWTILDDDDWIDPQHITQMVEAWNRVNERNESPLQVCGQNYTAHYADGTKPIKCNGWAVSLFERLTPAEVDYIYKLFPPDMVIASDSWISTNSFFDIRTFPGTPSYHWDRIGEDHLSRHETCRHDTPTGNMESHLNFWRIKLAARAKPLLPINLNAPHCETTHPVK